MVNQKRKGNLNDHHVPGKKRRLANGSPEKKAAPRQDPAELFAADLAVLTSDEKLPNSRVKEIYDSLRCRLLRLPAGASSQTAAAAAARAVLTSHQGRQLWRLLATSATAGQASAALRLLTACVAAGAGPARAVLAEFRFNHPRLPQVAAVKNLAAETDVRVEFVTFVLAFLVDTDRLLVQALLDKVTPLAQVLSGLSTDRASTVQLALSTLKQAVLENAAVAKKDKLRLFNARTLGPVLELYRWRGHQLSWRSRTNRYRKKKRPPASSPGAEDSDEPAGGGPDPGELEQVQSSAHEFLTLLCTSPQSGIVFRDGSLGTSGANCNPVLLDLLLSVRRPWRHPLTADLVVSTLAAAPDLCRLYLPSLSSTLCPPRQSAEWRGVVAMVTAAVAAVQLTPDQLTPEAVSTAATACYYPPAVVEIIREGVSHEEAEVRDASLQLLSTVLDQVAGLRSRLAGPARVALAASVSRQLPGARQLPEQIQLQLAAAQCAVPPGQPLLPSDVPRILAEIRGSPAPEITAETGETTAKSSHHRGTGDETTEEADETAEGMKTTDGEEQLPSLTGGSEQEVLASFVAMTTPLLQSTPPPLPALRSLADQLTAALSDVTPDDSDVTPIVDDVTPVSDVTHPAAAAGDDVISQLPAGWGRWVRLALKRCLREPELAAVLLPALTGLCQRGVFPCAGGAAEQTESASVSCELLYQLLLGHSAFLELLLAAEGAARAPLLRLLLSAARRCPHVGRTSHLAPLLAAYSASLSDSDQTVLLLMDQYERSGISLQPLQPLVWGSAALTFYNPGHGGGLSLRSQPTSGDVTSLLDADRMAATCRRLPLRMTLTPGARLPADDSVYDPRFLVPLLLRLTAAEQRCEPLQLVAAGAAGLAVCLLSCRRKEVRAAGCALLEGLYRQLQASRHRRQRLLWLTLLDLIRSAAAGQPARRLPFCVAHGWARLARILHQPEHRLFPRACSLLLRRAADGGIDPGRVPLFFELFNSSSALSHAAEQAWMVGHLCQSVRQMADYGTLQRTVTYKLVMGLAASCLAAGRQQLLQVLEVTARLPAALLDLHYRHGLTAWLTALLRRFGRQRATRAAIVAIAAQMARTLRTHGESGAQRPAALLAALETLVARLTEATRGEAALGAEVARVRREVAQLQACR